MTLSDISIKNPVFAWMLMIGLIAFGGISFTRTGISQMPDVDFPVVNISVIWTGASPEVMETNIVDVIEDAIMNVEGVKEVTSTSSYGQANITVELELSRNVDAALQEIQTRVAQSQRLLPPTMDPAVITKFNPEDQPIMFIAVSSEGEERDLMMYVWNVLKNKFSTVKGVGQVFLGGYTDRNLRVWVDGKKLSAHELTVDDVIQSIQNEHAEVPSGLIETNVSRRSVRSMGEASSVERFARLPINTRGGQPIFENIPHIRDVARVEDGLDDVVRISRFNGVRAVGLGIVKQRGTNAVEVAREARKRIESLKKELPPGYKLNIAFDSTKFIEESIGDLEFTLFLSAIFTGVVCYLFLGSFTSTINILLAIPTSIVGSFTLIYFFGFTLNTFTLLGLALAMGIVVDDAIMVLENIARHREMGESLVDGALKGAREITFAAMATSFAIIAIFLPVAFMSGVIGKFFFQFAVTITAAVALSLLEALTLTPMRCSQFLSVGHEGRLGHAIDASFHRLSGLYVYVLNIVLNHRVITVLVAAAFFIASFIFLIPIKKEFVPAQDQSTLLVRMQTPVGSSLYYTDALVKQAEAVLAKRPDVVGYFTVIGGFTGGDPNLGMFFLTLKEKGDRPIDPVKKRRLSQAEIGTVLRKELGAISPDLRVTVQDLSTRGFSSSRGFPVEFAVKGPDWDDLGKYSAQIMERMKASGKFDDVDSNYLVGQKEIQVLPNREAASSKGVSVAAVGTVIQAMIGGVRAGQFTDGGHRYYIRVRVENGERLRPEDINSLYVKNNRGELVRLSEVVTLKELPALQSITRLNRERAITIFANPSASSSQQEANDLAQKIAREVLPQNYGVALSGSAKTMKESFQSLGSALILGIFVAYMILASQFGSYLHPVTVLIAMPFSFSGAILALFFFGQSLNIYSFISLILLMGLVKKNSILLVDFTNRMRAGGMDVREALLHAGPVRLRPILMTSIATIAAAVPPALSLGLGGETRVPMAIALIGGMVVSTLLTLVVVPPVYSLFSRFERGELRYSAEEEQ